MIRLPVLLLLIVTASAVLSACSEFKKSAEYHDIVADYDYLREQITKTKSKKHRPAQIKKITHQKVTINPLIRPKLVIRSNCNTILRDLSKPNARIIWCIPRTTR